MADTNDDYGNELKWELLIADCWADDNLKQRLLKDPAAVCKERGISIPAGVKLNVVADSDAVCNIVIPSPPQEEELSEEQLESVAGGHTALCFSLCIGGCGCGGGGGCRSGCGGGGCRSGCGCGGGGCRSGCGCGGGGCRSGCGGGGGCRP